ncbi:MAG TPA: alternative ribosome rescue aminoacyl-tRNA hydrolase ArfB [Thermoanaerobaculia bacterium]|nr:alternative ribosome rescue aminoacyl-tRNA hydrolase ArfB [Thermoanaerobaculia bacterium]
MIEINEDLSIPDDEITLTASRSSGPGGQNVNKVNSRITLWFDIGKSTALDDAQKQKLLDALRSRVTGDGVLHVSSQRHRAQGANREAAIARFAELVREALSEQRPRKVTRVSKAARARRIEEKKQRGAIKKLRGTPPPE